MATSSRTDAINSQEMLLIFIRWNDGQVSVDEFVKSPRVLRMSHEDVQDRIDSIVTAYRSVVAVKRLDMATDHIEDISDKFDIRTAEQVEEDAAEITAALECSPAPKPPYSTVNHAQQGIQRVHGARL